MAENEHIQEFTIPLKDIAFIELGGELRSIETGRIMFVFEDLGRRIPFTMFLYEDGKKEPVYTLDADVFAIRDSEGEKGDKLSMKCFTMHQHAEKIKTPVFGIREGWDKPILQKDGNRDRHAFQLYVHGTDGKRFDVITGEYINGTPTIYEALAKSFDELGF